MDYLLKPVDAPRLRRTLERVHERLDRADVRESRVAGRMPYGWRPIRIAGAMPPGTT